MADSAELAIGLEVKETQTPEPPEPPEPSLLFQSRIQPCKKAAILHHLESMGMATQPRHDAQSHRSLTLVLTLALTLVLTLALTLPGISRRSSSAPLPALKGAQKHKIR